MLRITGGKVYDPANNINGVIKDVCISGGRVVDALEPGHGRTIDATGMVVFPGGVDVHTHVAGAALNFARGLIPEQHRQAQVMARTAVRRAGMGGSGRIGRTGAVVSARSFPPAARSRSLCSAAVAT